MKKIGLFYASETGNTRAVAKTIQQRYFGPGLMDLHDVEDADAATIEGYAALILGTPTVGCGEIPDSMEILLQRLGDASVRGKTVACFGLGDQVGYPHEFVDALGLLCEELESRGAEVVGDWPIDGYDFDASKADRGAGLFCGLVLDEDNQFELTESRLDAWIARIEPAMLSALGLKAPSREDRGVVA